MDHRRQDQRPASIAPEPWDEFAREQLPREPRPPLPTRTRMLFGALAVLLVVAVLGTTVFVAVRDLRAQAATSTSTTLSALATTTAQRSTPTTAPSLEPQDNGWTKVTGAAGDVKFSASSPQRGYLCGIDPSGHPTFGVTTNGGTTWKFARSPAAYESCSIQIAPTNALHVVVNSEAGPCAEPCPTLDAHYSTDGGNTWQAAPIPRNTVSQGGALWAGAYVYMWSSAIASRSQASFLKVSANGGPFVSIDLQKLFPSAQNVSIASPVVGGTKLYLNLTYTGCVSAICQFVVASSNGGKTWAQVPNAAGIQLMYVVGATLYGQMIDTQDPSAQVVLRSTDGGISWLPLLLPSLSNERPLSLDDQMSWLPTPDGTFFMASSNLGVVAYLRADAWVVIPFGPPDGYTVAAISLDAKGQPQRIWGLIGAQSSRAGIYWHAYP